MKNFTSQDKIQKRSIEFWFATVFGLGNAPWAPGTVATLVAGVPCFIIAGHFSWQAQLFIALAVAGIGWYVSDKTEKELRRPDPGEVVIDEVCGFLVAMIGRPLSPASILAGFLLFRLFDIWKPWPIRMIEKMLPGGMGIMADDVLAGIYANVSGAILLHFLK